MIKSHIFPALSQAGVSRTMSFKRRADFALYFSYAKTGLHSYVRSTASNDAILTVRCSDDLLPDSLFETKISGLNSAYVNLTEEAIANSTIQVTIELNESNVVTVTRAILLLPPVEDETAPTINGAQFLLLHDRLTDVLVSRPTQGLPREIWQQDDRRCR